MGARCGVEAVRRGWGCAGQERRRSGAQGAVVGRAGVEASRAGAAEEEWDGRGTGKGVVMAAG